MYKVLKNESDFDDWIRVLPDEVSVVSTQTAVKNSLKEVLQRFDTAEYNNSLVRIVLGIKDQCLKRCIRISDR